jgi:hypothetical protein
MIREKGKPTIAALGVVTLLASGCGDATESGYAPPPKSALASRQTSFRGPFQASLMVPTSRPKTGKSWNWRVTVRTNRGHPLAARVRVRFLFNGRVVGRGGRHAFKGSYGSTIRWPERSVGFPLVFRAALTTPKGKANLDYPLQVVD